MRSVSNEERESCEAQWSWNSKWTNDERGYKNLGIVEMDKIKETDMKEKLHEIQKEVEVYLKIEIEWQKLNIRN